MSTWVLLFFILEVQEQAEIQIDGDENQNSDNLWRKGLVLTEEGEEGMRKPRMLNFFFFF